jgi:hypothetical protein
MGRALSAAQMVEMWDVGSADGVDAARLLFEVSRPEDPAGRVDEVSIGSRDAWLLEVRQATFGPTVRGLLTCPACGQRLSLQVDSALLSRSAARLDLDPAEVVVDVGDVHVEARAPDGRALLAAASCADVESARTVLLERCVIRASAGDRPVSVASLTDEMVAAIGDAIVAAEPQSEVRLGAVCAACGHTWPAIFDIAPFLWTEVSTMAVRLLDEVHVLAAGYGWSEEQVLALSSRRRRHYLEQLVGG